MVSLVDQNLSILSDLKQFTRAEIEDFKDEKELEFVKGTFTLNDYQARMNYGDSYFCSLPIIVEGCVYRMKLYPGGWNVGKSTHISIGVSRTNLTCLDLDTCDAVKSIAKMLHPIDPSKDFS